MGGDRIFLPPPDSSIAPSFEMNHLKAYALLHWDIVFHKQIFTIPSNQIRPGFDRHFNLFTHPSSRLIFTDVFSFYGQQNITVIELIAFSALESFR